jgi:polysaccharide pyruvyl transferase CsaB
MVDAFLMGYYGARNLGDDLMLSCLRRVIENQGCSLTVLAENAPTVISQHQTAAEQNYPLLGQFDFLTAILRGAAFRLARRLLSADLIFAGGGDIFRDSLGLANFSYQTEKVVLAILARKPVVLINVGISEPQTAFGKALLRWVLPRCRMIIVRDQRSVNLCRRMGAGAHTVFLPDIVTAVPQLFAAELKSYHVTKPTAVVVALRHHSNVYGCFNLTPERIANVAAALDHLTERNNAEISFLPCQQSASEDDHNIHREIRSRMKNPGSTRLLDWTGDVLDTAATFAAARAVIAMRLHAGVLGVAFRKPTLLLPYDAKVAEFGASAGVRHTLSDKCLDSPDRIKTAFADLMNDADPASPPPAALEWCGPLLQSVVASACRHRSS